LIAALLRAPPREADDGAKIAVARAVLRQQHQLHTAHQQQFRADEQLESGLLRGHVRPHDAGEGTLVGDGERRIAERLRARHQLFRMRGAAQEAEIGDAVQFGIVR